MTLAARCLRVGALVCGATLWLRIYALETCLATTIDPFLWEELVLDADFVGIAECETAGGIVANYAVAESWKGAAVGTKLSIRVAVDYWEPQFPVALCDERYLVTAFKSATFPNVTSMTVGGAVPLWWRKALADYELPLFQGGVLLPLGKGERPLGGVGSDHTDLQSFKQAVSDFLKLRPSERELHLLRRFADKYLFLAQEQTGQLAALRKSLEQSGSASEFITILLDYGATGSKETRRTIGRILAHGAGTIALDMIERMPPDRFAADARSGQEILRSVRKRLGLPVPPSDEEFLNCNAEPLPTTAEFKRMKRIIEESFSSPQPRMPSEARKYSAAQMRRFLCLVDRYEREHNPTERELRQLRKELANGPSAQRFDNIFPLLTAHDPGPMAEYLAKWINPNRERWDRDRGYVLGSYFGWRCGKDRAKHLRTLFGARDPYIRVAGAVYLCFENRELGTAKLKEFSRLEGDPGVWAALNLARRGEKAYVSRALEVFATTGEAGMAGVPHGNLQKRVLVLLSNTAKKNGLPRPDFPQSASSAEATDAYMRRVYESLRSWWNTHQDNASLYDPWLPLFEEQKVD